MSSCFVTSTMKEVREVINRHSELLSDLRDSMAPPMLAFSTRILALTLKDEGFAIHSAASDPVVEEFFTHVHFIEPGLDRNHLRKADLKDASALKAFMDAHCHMSQYVFQVKKCNDESCVYCTGHPIRMPKEVFDSVRFLPLPRLDGTKKHYRPFSELFGEEPSDVDRPSRVPDNDGAQADKENTQLFRNTRVRRVVACRNCLKPHCVFAAKVLTPQEKAAVA